MAQSQNIHFFVIHEYFLDSKPNFPWNIQTVSLKVAEKWSILVFDQNYSDETLIQILNYHTIQAAWLSNFRNMFQARNQISYGIFKQCHWKRPQSQKNGRWRMDIWTKKKSPEEPFFHVSYIALHLQLYSCKMLDSALYPDLYFLSKN